MLIVVINQTKQILCWKAKS